MLTVETRDGAAGTLAYVNHRYHEKAAYINPNLAGQGACASPFNMLHNSDGHLVRPRMYPAHNRAMDSTLVDEYTVWFNKGVGNSDDNVLRDNMRLWVKEVCSDGGEGSVRVPMQFDVSNIDAGSAANVDTKFFYDFACPYGSQPEACPPREGLQQYQETMDELYQPSGPAFANCFDEDVPDFECCHATHEFRIHGGEGTVGRTGFDDLQYCALTEAGTNPDLPNLYSYDSDGMNTAHPGGLTPLVRPTDPVEQWNTPEFSHSDGIFPAGYYTNMTRTSCQALCDSDATSTFYAYVAGQAPNAYPSSGTVKTCNSITMYSHYCWLYEEGEGEYAAISKQGSEARHKLPVEYTWDEVTRIEGSCPLHYTSYHHTPTGCKAFCRAAFQREGNDNTCMPAKPECANWLDAVSFPSEQYVTVDTECICGAKLEEFQGSGKYVHTGTVLQGTRARVRDRALHEDDGADDGPWGWPDAVPAGIDQFHGKTPITSLKHAHTHTLTQTHKRTFRRWSNRMAPSLSTLLRSNLAHSIAGAHFDVGDTCIAEIMSFRTDLLNNSQCDNYLDLTVADIPTEWGPNVTSSHVRCTEDGTTDDQCCVAHRGDAQASRLWLQEGNMDTSSVAQSFTRSAIVGTAVHTSRVAAVGNFVRRFAPFKP